MTDATAQSTSAVASASLVFVLVLFGLVLTLGYIVPALIIWWKLFAKAGKPGWAAIVPVYSSVVMAQIGEKPLWMGLFVGLGNLFSSAFPSAIRGILNIAALVISIIILLALIKKYDRGAGFWILVIFLPIVGVFMVKDANYIGGAVPGAPVGGAPVAAMPQAVPAPVMPATAVAPEAPAAPDAPTVPDQTQPPTL